MSGLELNFVQYKHDRTLTVSQKVCTERGWHINTRLVNFQCH